LENVNKKTLHTISYEECRNKFRQGGHNATTVFSKSSDVVHFLPAILIFNNLQVRNFKN